MAKKRRVSKKKSSGTLSNRSFLLIVLFLVLAIAFAIFYTTDGSTEQSEQLRKMAKVTTEKVKDVVDKNTPKIGGKGVKEVIESVEKTLSTKLGKEPSSQPNSNTTNSYSGYQEGLRLETPQLGDSTLYYYNKDARFGVKFSPKDKVAYWVSYVLTRDEVKKSAVERSDKFVVDNYYNYRNQPTATNSDYYKSGYDKGHLLPSANRDDSRRENDATFLFSNIAPQRPNLNRVTIRKLEEEERSWAKQFDSLYVVTGAILDCDKPKQHIGKGVTVPPYFYKAYVAWNRGKCQMIGFLMPNSNSVDKDFWEYAVSIDSVEAASGENFFHPLSDSLESLHEKSFSEKCWRQYSVF